MTVLSRSKGKGISIGVGRSKGKEQMSDNLNQDYSPPGRCPKCNYSGLINAIEIKSGSEYSFRCDCHHAKSRNFSKSIPEWHSSFMGRFKVEFDQRGMNGSNAPINDPVVLNKINKLITKSEFIEPKESGDDCPF